MKTHRLQTELWVPEKIEWVFNFFADAGNLERITPGWLRFELLTSRGVKLRAGTLLDYRLRLRGIPLRWQSEIAVWDPPHRFVDRQTSGPYSLWVHEHTFLDANGGTMVQDDVEYAVPGGSLIQKLFVAPDLVRIFAYRREALRQVFAPNASTGIRDHDHYRTLKEI